MFQVGNREKKFFSIYHRKNFLYAYIIFKDVIRIVSRISNHSWQKVNKPPILWRPLFCFSPPPSLIHQPHTLVPFVVLLIWLNLLSHQIKCIILLFGIMLLTLDTLIPAAPCCVFYATRNQIHWRCDTDDLVFTGTLMW